MQVPHRKFCEAIVAGSRSGDAYAAAFPDAALSTRWTGGSRLLARPDVQAEIARLRAASDEADGSAVLTLLDKRRFLARIVRARPGMLGEESELWQKVRVNEKCVRLRLPDKLGAIKLDNAIAGKGSKLAAANEELRQREESILEMYRSAKEGYPAWQARMKEGEKALEKAWVRGWGANARGGGGAGAGAGSSDGGTNSGLPAEQWSGSFVEEKLRAESSRPSFIDELARVRAAAPGGTGAGQPGPAAPPPPVAETVYDRGETIDEPAYFARSVLRPPGAVPAVCRGRLLMKKMAPGRGVLPIICRNARRRARQERMVILPPNEDAAPPESAIGNQEGTSQQEEDFATAPARCATRRRAARTSQRMSGPQRKFCEGIVAGLSRTDAYAAAYPRAGRRTARSAGAALRRRKRICEEIEALRAKAAELGGADVLGVEEKRRFLARVVLARAARLGEDSDLWQSVTRSESGVELGLPDKLRAIALDNEFEEEAPAESPIIKEFHEMIVRIRSKPWRPPEKTPAEAPRRMAS